MIKKIREQMSRTPVHPARHIKRDLEALNWTETDLAGAIKVPIESIHQILIEKEPVTADLALRLGKLFGMGPDIWLNLQARYDLALIRSSEKEAEIDSIVALPHPENLSVST
jgi:addiction module HigA family antidote